MTSSFCTLLRTTLGLAIGGFVYVAGAAAPEPRSNAAVPPPAAAESITPDFLQPLSRDLQRQLPDLGRRADQEKRAEPPDPGFHTLWVLPKAPTGNDAPEQPMRSPTR